MKKIGELFLELRTTRNWTLKEMENASGVRATYYHYVEVTNKMPSIEIVKRLSIAYDVSPLIFFDTVQFEGVKK
ncbi:helix-turn-helix domain-containing protein [Lysinibacillus sp. NPDC093692]|uniref:helix-turn-helix domain-containing protein n=1 Tax=Lysinibacillus sp. NPDC093692 TaxID=3390578 RepID=UPI003D0501D0